MKIMIIGSTAFAEQMVNYRQKLIDLGHEVILHEHYRNWGSGQKAEINYDGDQLTLDHKELIKKIEAKEHAKLKKENNYIKVHYEEILESDAVLVLNFDKNDIKNYIGGNTLIEIGQAYVNNKKIFLLNPIPKMSYAAEIEAMEPIVLNRRLDKIDQLVKN